MTSRANIIGAVEAKRALDNCASWRRACNITFIAGVAMSAAAHMGAGFSVGIAGLALILLWFPCYWRQRVCLRAARRWLHGGAS